MRRKQIGVVGVDSGQLMVCDPCYVDSEWRKVEYGAYVPEGDFSYPGVCAVTAPAGQLNYRMGHEGVGVAFSSGYGDGTYPVFATFAEDGRVTRVEIVMIDAAGRHCYDEGFDPEDGCLNND